MSESVVVQQQLKASTAEVWSAITEAAKMKIWYFTLSGFEAVPGFEFQFRGEGTDGEPYIHLCRVLEVTAEKKLSYTWSYQGFEGSSVVSFELQPDTDGTLLTLTHTGLETFPKSPAFQKSNFEYGWNYLIGTSLKQFVEKN